MSDSKIHIDELFARGLENLEIPIHSNDFDSINKDITPDQGNEISPEKEVFENFELDVTDTDWQIIKYRLAKEKEKLSGLTPEGFAAESFKDFELAVTDADWKTIKDRLPKEQEKTAGVIIPEGFAAESFKDFEIAVTDADWKATKSKLDKFNRKKIVWWWWLNMFVIASLIGLAVYYFTPSAKTNNQASGAVPTDEKANAPLVKNSDKANTTSPNATEAPNQENELKQENVNTLPKISIAQSTQDNTQTTKANDNKAVKSANTSSANSHYTIPINGAENTNTADKASSGNDAPSKTSVDPANNPVEVADNNGNNNDQNAINEEKNSDLPVNAANDDKKDVKITIVDPLNPGLTPFNTTVINKADPLVPAIFLILIKPETLVNPILPSPPPAPKLIYYVGLTTDIARTYRQLSSENDSFYNAIRNNADKPLTQFSYGFTAGLQKGKNQFQTGVQYTQQTFVSNYHYTYKYRKLLPVYDPNGNLIGYFPIGPYLDTTIDVSEQVTLKKIEIPFAYNRFWKLNDKTQLITGFGGVLSINTGSEGTKTLNPANNQLYDYSYLKGSEKKTGFSPSVNIGVQRKLGSNLALQCNVFGKYSVTNRYDTDFTAKQFPYSQNTSSFTAKEYLYSYGLSIKLLYLLD